MSKYAVPSSTLPTIKFSEDIIRPNTTNNAHRLSSPKETLQAASSFNIEERKQALTALRTLSLDDATKKQMWTNEQQRAIITTAASSKEPIDIRIEALHTLKNISFHVDCIVDMWNDPTSHQVITDAVLDHTAGVRVQQVAVHCLINLSSNDQNKASMYEQLCWNLANSITMMRRPNKGSETMVCDCYKTLGRLAAHASNQDRYYESLDMKKTLFMACAMDQPNSIRAQAYGVLQQLALHPSVAQVMWKRIDGAQHLLLEATQDTNAAGQYTMKATYDAKNNILVRENAFHAISSLAGYPNNQLAMFDNQVLIDRIVSGANTRQAQRVRRYAIQTLRHLSTNEQVARRMWVQHPQLTKIICAGGQKNVVNFFRVESLLTVVNLASIEENRRSMWQSRGLREIVLSACEVVATARPVDSTPPIEAAGLTALGLLTGVDMCVGK
jgi:hypothetical protein